MQIFFTVETVKTVTLEVESEDSDERSRLVISLLLRCFKVTDRLVTGDC